MSAESGEAQDDPFASAPPVPVKSEKDIANWFKANPGKLDSIGFFGHGNSDGIYINRKEVSSGTLKLFAAHLNPRGKAYFFACEVGSAGGGTPNAWAAKYFHQGQTIYAAKDLIHYQVRHPGNVHTGYMTTDNDRLWMWSYSGGKKP